MNPAWERQDADHFAHAGGLLAGQHDCKQERTPPSRPIPVTFPALTPPEPSLRHPPSTWTKDPSSRIPAHFLHIKKPSDANLETLALLNVSFAPQCDFETLVPYLANNGQPYLPPKSWLEAPDQGNPKTSLAPEASVSLLSNGRKAPDRTDFHGRARELYFKNEDAFAALTRKPNPGQVPPRLAHFRKFWEGLDNLAYYWDNSMDVYLPPKEEHANSGMQEASPESSSAQSNIFDEQSAEPRKKAKIEAASTGTANLPINSLGFGNSTAPLPPKRIASSEDLPPRSVPPKVPWAVNFHSISARPVDLSKGSYSGYRIGNGDEMPDQYRLDCVRAFLEPIAWGFAVTLAPHRRPPVLCLEHVRFPVRMNCAGWRGPTDRLRARQGYMEGPLFGIQCRADTVFGSTGDMQADSALDVVRELGGMLLLAQERAREGKKEVRAGEGQWWTSKRRWGGGPGGEVGEAAESGDAAPQEPTTDPEGKPNSRLKALGKDRRRLSPAEMWKVLKTGNPLWDPKIVYEAIGKDKSSDWDEIFMVSSLNTHISVLKLRVHRLYIQYLTDGTLPLEEPSDPAWFSPILQRTRWYDLFSVEDRTEAMRGIWGVVAYLMRSQEEHSLDVPIQD